MAWIWKVIFFNFETICVLKRARLWMKRHSVQIKLGYSLRWQRHERNRWLRTWNLILSVINLNDWVLVILFNLLVDAVDIYVILFILHLFSVVFAYFLSVISFLLWVEESTNFALVAARAIAVNPFILIRMVQTLDCGVALVAKKTLRALLPTRFSCLICSGHILTIFRNVFKYLWRSPKITHMVRVYATFRIMWIFFVRAPTRLVPKHVKSKCFQRFINWVKILHEWRRFKQTVKNKVIFSVFVLAALIHTLDQLQIGQIKILKVIGLMAKIKTHNKRSVKPVLTI